jgi:hypothetical protein
MKILRPDGCVPGKIDPVDAGVLRRTGPGLSHMGDYEQRDRCLSGVASELLGRIRDTTRTACRFELKNPLPSMRIREAEVGLGAGTARTVPLKVEVLLV